MSPSLKNNEMKEQTFSFFLPDFDFEFGNFNALQLKQQFEQFMMQNPEAFEEMQNQFADLENDDEDDDEDEDVDLVDDFGDDGDDAKLLDFSFGGDAPAFTINAAQYFQSINPLEQWEANHALAAETAYLQQQAYAAAIYEKQLQQDFSGLTGQPPPEMFGDYGFGGRGRGRGRGRGGYRSSHRRTRRRRDHGITYRRGRNIKHRLSVFATNRYAFLPSKEIKQANEKLMEIYYQAQWAVTIDCLSMFTMATKYVVQHSAHKTLV